MKNESNNAHIPSLADDAQWMRLWFFFHDQDLGVRIKNAVQEFYDVYVTGASRHIGLRAVTLLTFGEILDKVITY